MKVSPVVSFLQEVGAIVASVYAYAHASAIGAHFGLDATAVDSGVTALLAVALQQQPVILRYLDGFLSTIASAGRPGPAPGLG